MDKSVGMVENQSFDAELAYYRLGVFAKQPIPGRVKTRLTPPLSSAEAAELYQVSLRETLERCEAAGLAPVLFYSGERDYFRTAFPEIELVPQVSGDLGVRMTAALQFMLRESGCQGGVLIGSDSPDLPPGYLREAISALAVHDCVVAPAVDGGYVLIGMRHLCRELFEKIPWSSSEVLVATRRNAERIGLSYHEISAWDDVDDLHSLHRLLKRSPLSKTAQFAARRLARHFPGN